MSIKYNNKTIAGYYKTEIIPNADTVNAGKIRIATQAEVDSGESNSTAVTPSYLSKKQDKLTAGKNITIENGVISADTTTGINVDGETISNENAVLSSIGTKTKSNTIKIDWEGTEAEYEAGLADGTISNDWYCYITDDETVVDFADHTELEVQNMYKTGEISTDTTGYNQLVEMKRSTFDLSKFTVVGSPTITDDGIASGFLKDTETGYDSSPNCVRVNNFTLGQLKDKPWSMSCSFVLPDIVSPTNKTLYSLGQTQRWEAWSNSFAMETNGYFHINSRFGTNKINSGNLAIFRSAYSSIGMIRGSSYTYITEFDGISVYTYKIVDNKTGDVLKTVTYTPTTEDKNLFTVNLHPNETINIGMANSAYANQYNNWQGSIDLKHFSITVDGKEVFSGNKTGIDTVKIGGETVEIPYTLSKTGSKIVDVAYRDKVQALYNQEGKADYYTIDETNKNFTLPMGEIYGMKANSDLSNLTTAGEKHFLNKSQITNCLLEVPQRIKLELNDGVLTLKAGSVVIVPNGFEADGTTPKFDYVTIESDKTISNGHNTSDLVWYAGNGLDLLPLSLIYSGSTAPSDNQYMLWYDTTNNQTKYTNNSGASWSAGQSLPLGVISTSSSAPTSIDQVFNGMGYIGSTVWVDKGVKGLVSNGRNEDGSLINEEVTTDKLYTLTKNWGTSSRIFGYELSDGTDIIPENHLIADKLSLVYEQPVMPTGTAWKWIDTANNQVWFKDENNPSVILQKPYKIKNMFLGNFTTVEGRITSFAPKLPFRALDYSDKTKITNWSFPSDKYIDLTLGASGATYTAPADGWVYYYASSTTRNTAHNAYCRLEQGGRPVVELRAQPRINLTTDASKTSEIICLLIPVIRGNFRIMYRGFNAQDANNPYFRFYYTVGSEPLA